MLKAAIRVLSKLVIDAGRREREREGTGAESEGRPPFFAALLLN